MAGNVVQFEEVVLQKLKCIDVVMAHLRSGGSPEALAIYIQESSRELVSMDRGALVSMLAGVQARLLAMVEPERLLRRVDPVEECDRLYDIQVTRLRWMLVLESEAQFPLKNFPSEMKVAKDLLVAKGLLQGSIGGLNMSEGEQQDARMRELESKYGSTIVGLLSQQGTRRRMLGVLDAIRAETSMKEGDDGSEG